VAAVQPPTAPVASGLVVLPGIAHTWQKWNNCGPSTVLMALSAFGLTLDQLDVAAQIKPDREDTNVSPDELAAFARVQGLEAIVRLNGDRHVARALLRSGVPVLAEQWIDVEGRGQMGHYRLITGFDDSAGEFVVHDSYYGPSRRHAFDDLERMWRPFLGTYVVVYRAAQEPAVRAAIGADWDDDAMRSRALERAQAWSVSDANEAWAWFALGEARAGLGDFGGSVAAFDRAIAIGLPFRAFWYQFGYYRALVETGAYERAVAHADMTLETMGGENLEESHYWRGVALARMGRMEEARASLERALEFNPLFEPARAALAEMVPAAGS
jgi:tetratricopeptide (TPR) repeat protein